MYIYINKVSKFELQTLASKVLPVASKYIYIYIIYIYSFIIAYSFVKFTSKFPEIFFFINITPKL